MLAALSVLAMEKGAITRGEFQTAMQKAHDGQRAKRTREGLAKLAESVNIQHILKDLEGPPQ